MKKILILLLFPSICMAQKPRTYFNIEAEVYNYSHADPSFGGSISLGVKGQYIGAGIGFAVTQLAGTSSPYAPVFFELSAYSNKRVARPYANVQIGYGIYSNDGVYIYHQTGGLFFRPGAGILLPVKKRDFIIKVSYVSSVFNIQTNTGQSISSATSTGWCASLGFRL